MKERKFREMMAERQAKVGSLVCVGLNPLPEKMPECLREYEYSPYGLTLWMKRIVDATVRHTSIFKLQGAHFEAWPNMIGREALREIVSYIHREYPDVPVFLDCKRGDIGRTQQQYKIAHFEIDGVDGMNFNPYMGKGCMENLIDKKYPGRAIVGLCRTSNPDAWEIQDLICRNGIRYFEFIAQRTLTWADELGILENAGLVLGSAHKASLLNGHMHHFGQNWDEDKIYDYHLKRVREIVRNLLWFLIPGIGTQEGFVEATVKSAYCGPGSIAINSSSGIIFASSGKDYAEAAEMKAEELKNQINLYVVQQ